MRKLFQNPTAVRGKRPGSKSFAINGQQFTPHTDLDLHETAVFNLIPKQKAILLGAVLFLAAALFLNWHAVVQALVIIFTLVYFADVLFNLYLVYRAFTHKKEYEISESEIASVAQNEWPSYTIFCPLYREAEVVPQFTQAMKQMEYPAEKLQVLFLLEEDDQDTISKIQSMNLPENFEVTVVPHSLPKTKPKAMNYGLRFAKGEYVTIYDAEDIPDPLQLKKVVLAFKKAGPQTVCVQSKLNFYNTRQNLLTKLFTAEYSLWFDLILPGLQSLDAPIPLGGTSNHFRTEDLKRLKGWDAFNVTEDCDLGIRLSKSGFQTAMVNSTTWEEANSEPHNWYIQRSRWIKGYMQTFLVHMRHWRVIVRNRGFRDLAFFQLVVGGKVISIFVNPIMWAMTIAYFLFRPQVAPVIETFFPAPVLYMGVFSFVFGNFFYVYNYMIGCAKRDFDGLVKYTFLVPLYWLGMSIAAWKALAELVFKPHYWAKTTHGLHLESHGKPAAAAAKTPAFSPAPQAATVPQTGISGSGILVVATVAASAANFLFSAILGRLLTLEQFGILTLFNTFSTVLSVAAVGLASTVNHQVAFLGGRGEQERALGFWMNIRKYNAVVALAVSAAWLAATPLIANFFHMPGLLLGVLFTPVLVFGLDIAVNKGLLQGAMSFGLVGAAVLIESVAKLGFALFFVSAGLKPWAVLSLPLSAAATFIVVYALALKAKNKLRNSAVPSASPEAVPFPWKLFTSAMMAGLSATLFLSVDVILAKHFLSPVEAGQYALLSLAGKMIFYAGSLSGTFIMTLTSRDIGQGRNPAPLFYKLLSAATAVVAAMWAGLVMFGKEAVPFLFGQKAVEILPHLPAYAGAIALFTIATAFIIHHLGRRQMTFSIISLAAAAAAAAGIWSSHSSIADITKVMLLSAAFLLASVITLHVLQRNGKFIIRSFIDLVDAFFPLSGTADGGKRILIFNWRDTKHVYAGGAEVYIQELAKRWTADGSHVTIFCGNDGKSAREETIDGVRIIRRGGFYFVYLWAFVYYLLQFRGRFDLIVDCQNGIPFFAPLYAKEPVVCLLHHIHQDVFRKYLNRPLAWLASVLEGKMMPWAYRHTKFITISNSSKKNMERLGLGQAGVDIIHPGVDLSSLHPGTKSKHPLVLYLGRLKAYKSIDVLIKSFRLIVKKLPEARMVIAGSGEEDRRLKRLALSLGLQEHIQFLGKISESEKLHWLQQAWVLVNPSMVEGWGITVIEANACGVPVVAAQVAGLCDSVRDEVTGFLVPHGDVEGFAEKIAALLQDHALRTRMGNFALHWAKNFDWGQLSKLGMSKLFEQDPSSAEQPLPQEAPVRQQRIKVRVSRSPNA